MKSKIVMMLILCVVLSACGLKGARNEIKLTEKQIDELMVQYVQGNEYYYEQSGGHSPVKMKVRIEDDKILFEM